MIEANKSRCWDCKHGLCFLEKETEHILHSGMRELESDFDIFSSSDEEELVEHTIEHERVRAICFAREHPIPVMMVKQCNHFEER